MSDELGAPSRVTYLGDVQRLRLKHNDVLVVTCDSHISCEMGERIKQQLVQVVGSKRKILVLGSGMKLGVLEPEEA